MIASKLTGLAWVSVVLFGCAPSPPDDRMFRLSFVPPYTSEVKTGPDFDVTEVGLNGAPILACYSGHNPDLTDLEKVEPQRLAVGAASGRLWRGSGDDPSRMDVVIDRYRGINRGVYVHCTKAMEADEGVFLHAIRNMQVEYN